MKNSAVVTVNKLLNLSELGIEPIEICWNKVKMTSSRWITCCHRKLKKTCPPGESADRFRYGPEHKAEHVGGNGISNTRNTVYSTDNDLYSTTITRNVIGSSAGVNNGNSSSGGASGVSMKPRNGHLNRSPINSKHSTPNHRNSSNHHPHHHHHQHHHQSEFISSSYQTNEHHLAQQQSQPQPQQQQAQPSQQQQHSQAQQSSQSSSFRNFPNGFCSSSISSQFTPSSASPVSGSSIYERKSSASSSASSNHSSYSAIGGNTKESAGQLHSSHFVTTLMRHSKSSMDLNHHHCSPYSGGNYTHSLSRPGSKQRDSLTKPVLSIENTITIINPRDGALISCQTDEDSNCAQISPKINVIAVSNEYWIAFYSISTNDRLGVLELPRSCSYWTWISADTVAVVSRGEVLHWSLPNSDAAESNCIRAYDRKRLVFELDTEVATNQIINYAVDPLFGNWCALSTLYLDECGDVEGKVQIYSHLNKQSQCIKAHSCTFAAYKFDDSDQRSTMLLVARREKDRRWKLHIIELGPIPEGNLSHRPISHVLQEHKHSDRQPETAKGRHSVECSTDIPTHIACDSSLGLIYLLSKYGSFYICDIETGVPLYYDTFHDLTAGSALFTFSYDESTSSLLSVSRAGLVLTFQVSLDKLLASNRNGKVAPKVLERIQKRYRAKSIKSSSRPSSVTKHLQQFEQIFDPLTDSNYSSSPTTSELESSSTHNTISSPYRFHYGDKANHHGVDVDDDVDDVDDVGDDDDVDVVDVDVERQFNHSSVGHFLNGSVRPQPIYVESDCSEEVTRL